MMNHVVSLDESAVTTFKQWIEDDPRPRLAFRVSVEPGGCAGLRYEVILDDRRAPDDIVYSCDGVDVVCDPRTARYIQGATISYSETWFRGRQPERARRVYVRSILLGSYLGWLRGRNVHV